MTLKHRLIGASIGLALFSGTLAITLRAEATQNSPKTRPAKYIETYPKTFHERIVKACVQTLGTQNPGYDKQSVLNLCDCTFWNVEDKVGFPDFLRMSDEQRTIFVFAAINGCALHLGEKDKR